MMRWPHRRDGMINEGLTIRWHVGAQDMDKLATASFMEEIELLKAPHTLTLARPQTLALSHSHTP